MTFLANNDARARAGACGAGGGGAPRGRAGLGRAGAGVDVRSGVPGRIGGAVVRAGIYHHKG